MIGLALPGAGRMAPVHAKANRKPRATDHRQPQSEHKLRGAGSSFHILHGPLWGQLPPGDRNLSWRQARRHRSMTSTADGRHTWRRLPVRRFGWGGPSNSKPTAK